MGSLEDARAIVLEGNGSFSVISAEQFGEGEAVASTPEVRDHEHVAGDGGSDG
jgi:hypothetical protein